MSPIYEIRKGGIPVNLGLGFKNKLSALRDKNALVCLKEFLECPIVGAEERVKLLKREIWSVEIGIEGKLGCDFSERIAKLLGSRSLWLQRRRRRGDGNRCLKQRAYSLFDMAVLVPINHGHDLRRDNQFHVACNRVALLTLGFLLLLRQGKQILVAALKLSQSGEIRDRKLRHAAFASRIGSDLLDGFERFVH